MSIRRLLAGSLVLSLCLLSGCGDANPGLEVGQKAPEITGTSTDGAPIRLSQFQGKVVLLDFWATWCGPCRELIPHAKDLHRRYDGRPFAILGISLDRSSQDVATFTDREKLPWPNIFDGSGNISEQWNVQALPTLVLVDHQGLIAGRWVGGKQMSEIQETIEKAIHAAEKK